ncbi:helix-turn-helix domain-containing protein [Micrococcus terreus]|uniref:helix-turn-helix domain-containing protein n=1 Tax=Micrococcus terreus TaxID=574650 RepID=UPI003CCDA28F
MPTRLLTVKEAAAVLREHEQTTRKRLRSGELPGVRKSDSPRARWYVTESTVEAFIRRRTV